MKKSPRFSPKCSGCEVADVFYEAWEALRPQVQDALSKITYTSVFFTGHDLGGAIAAIATYDMTANHGAPLGRSYSFGQPRVGNKAFAAELNKLQFFRVTHHTDSVVHVPPHDKVRVVARVCVCVCVCVCECVRAGACAGACLCLCVCLCVCV